MSIRTERVASLLKEEIGAILSRDYRDPSHAFTTVTDVKLSPDLKIAKVYFSVFGGPAAQQTAMARLEGDRARIRKEVGSHLRMKFIPALQFYLDDTLDHVDRINTLIKKIHDGSTS